MTEKKTAEEHDEIIQALENQVAAGHIRVRNARDGLRRATTDRDMAILDFQAQYPKISPEENIRWTLQRAQELRAERKAAGLPLDGPAVVGRHGPSAIDHIAAAQRGGRSRTPGSDGFRRGSAPQNYQNQKLPSQK